ncbi:MAG: hypothetical protein B7733_19330 [Myxococcales bacterium FL481]|nr:MAG: hypothetical protein B7733_19330 [Myxococcales bacterium FL481]
MTPPQLAIARHLTMGWMFLVVFIALGTGLETLHGFRVAAYLDVAHSTRRHLWTLAHAHGTLFGLVHLGYAFTLARIGDRATSSPPGSLALTVATTIIPTGFFFAGVGAMDDEPGYAIFGVPVGAVLLLYAAVRTSLACRRAAAQRDAT